MPSIYKKKSGAELKRKPRKTLNFDVIQRAYSDVVDNGKSIRTAAKDYDVPKSTLARYVKARNLPDTSTFGSVHTSKQIFTKAEEDHLATYLIKASHMHYGLDLKQTKELAYQFAIANKKTVPETWETNKTAGKFWLLGFFHRHPNLSLRKPEATSLSRATSFNRKNVSEFFEKLEALYARYNFDPSQVFNIDETGFTTVQNPGKIIAEKGKKQVGKVTSAERGSLVTVCCAINAIGNSVPPFFIFPRVNFRDYMLKNAPHGSAGTASPSGWMTTSIFMDYMKHFAANVSSSKEKPILLILDNHESHISIDVINFSRENGIHILTLPPHCSNKLQPLDVSVFYAFKRFYNNEADKWMMNNPGKTITIYEIAELVGKAYSPAFSKSNIESGFSKTGIYPCNADIFTDIDFLSSSVTDRPVPNEPNIDGMSNSTAITEDLAVAGSSKAGDGNGNPTFVSPELVRPYPVAPPRKKTTAGRKPGRTRILTDTPEKLEIEENLKAKMMKNTKRQVFNEPNTSKATTNKKGSKRKADTSSSSSEEDQEVLFEESDQSPYEEEVPSDENEEEFSGFKIKDFVIVKFFIKHNGTFVHYIGQIIEKNNGNSEEGGFSVKFLRRRGISNVFSYPLIDDIQNVIESDIVKRVSMVTGQRNYFKFHLNSLNVSNLR